MTKKMVYHPVGVCSQKYEITITNGRIDDIKVFGGCDGNLKALSALLVGMDVEEAIKRMSGTNCGDRGTSCPDQIAKALKSAL